VPVKHGLNEDLPYPHSTSLTNLASYRYLSEGRLIAAPIAFINAVLRPVIVSAEGLIIDGHHRVEALRALGARYALALIVNYRVEVEGDHVLRLLSSEPSLKASLRSSRGS